MSATLLHVYTETLVRHYSVLKGSKDEAVWLLWPLPGFVLGRPNFKSFATLENSQLVASCQLGFIILLGSI